MSKLIKLLSSLIIFVSLFQYGFPVLASMKIADLSWDKNSSGILNSAVKEDIEMFIFNQTSNDKKTLSELKKEYSVLSKVDNSFTLSDIDFLHKILEICEFKFMDLKGDGKLELVVSLNKGGRNCTSLMIFWKDSQNGFYSQEIESWKDGQYSQGYDFNKELIDLNEDGIMEIICLEPITSYGGVHPMAFWPSVYKLDGAKYVKADKEFPNFYKTNVIPGLQNKINEIMGGGLTDSEKEAATSQYYLPLDKANRLLGIEPKSGLNRAIQWFNSDNKDLKQDALVVFGEIADEKSLDYLSAAAKEEDIIISTRAKKVLEKLGK